VQTEKAIEVHADIPGVNKEDIKLDVENDVLSLSVETKQEKEEDTTEKGVEWHHTERSRMFMKRSLRLPDTADLENVKASYEQGVLKVVVPKREVVNKNKRIAIS
jgi:HSP20 family protein